MSRYARRAAVHTMGADRNAGPLKTYAEALGLSVQVNHGGDGCPDWTVGGWGVTGHAEVKPELVRGEVFASQAKLNALQLGWALRWRGSKPFLLRTHADVLEMANTMRGWSRRMGK